MQSKCISSPAKIGKKILTMKTISVAFQSSISMAGSCGPDEFLIIQFAKTLKGSVDVVVVCLGGH